MSAVICLLPGSYRPQQCKESLASTVAPHVSPLHSMTCSHPINASQPSAVSLRIAASLAAVEPH